MRRETLATVGEISNAVRDLRREVERARIETTVAHDIERRSRRRAALFSALDILPPLRDRLDGLADLSDNPDAQLAANALYIAEAYARGGVDRRDSNAILRALLDLGDRLADAAEALAQVKG